MTQQEPKARKGSGQSQPAGQRPSGSSPRPSTSPTGTPRAGRRAASRYHQPEPTLMQRLRTPALVLIVIARRRPDRPVRGDRGDIVRLRLLDDRHADPHRRWRARPGPARPGQPHVSPGDKVTYLICPPASGKHINAPPRGPIPPKFYGPNDSVVPNGWVHNLEHGGLVLLYSCDKGACDDATQEQLRALVSGFPASAVCGVAPGIVSPVVAHFEQMPTKFAALVWDRVMYMDTLDTQQVYDFYLRYAERVSEGRFVAPPEPQCAVPSQSAAPSDAPSASPAASPSTPASPVASPSTGASPAASPATSAEPSPAAS